MITSVLYDGIKSVINKTTTLSSSEGTIDFVATDFNPLKIKR
ncbi:hypothetical protein [Flavobacterium collinsii]|nr:hypothetical protein [Flavobacterium collinsii]